MTPQRDPLELELESISPPPLPPVVRARIAAAMQDERQSASPRSLRNLRPHAFRWVLAGALAAAACVAAGVVWFHGRPPGPAIVKTTQELPQPPSTRVAARARQPVTLAAYMRAAGRSSAEVDALLDAEAARPLGSPTKAFTRSID